MMKPLLAIVGGFAASQFFDVPWALGLGLAVASYFVFEDLHRNTVGQIEVGEVPPVVDVRRVKRYREAHPGATIADALRAHSS
jgi:hypothetical protein